MVLKSLSSGAAFNGFKLSATIYLLTGVGNGQPQLCTGRVARQLGHIDLRSLEQPATHAGIAGEWATL